MNNEELLEELEAVKNCVEMTNDKIGHNKTRDDIVGILNNQHTVTKNQLHEVL